MYVGPARMMVRPQVKLYGVPEPGKVTVHWLSATVQVPTRGADCRRSSESAETELAGRAATLVTRARTGKVLNFMMRSVHLGGHE